MRTKQRHPFLNSRQTAKSPEGLTLKEKRSALEWNTKVLGSKAKKIMEAANQERDVKTALLSLASLLDDTEYSVTAVATKYDEKTGEALDFRWKPHGVWNGSLYEHHMLILEGSPLHTFIEKIPRTSEYVAAFQTADGKTTYVLDREQATTGPGGHTQPTHLRIRKSIKL